MTRLDSAQQVLGEKLVSIGVWALVLIGIDAAGHQPDRADRVFRRLWPCHRFRPAKDLRQPDFRHHPADGPLDQAGRRDRGGQRQRKTVGKVEDRHPRRLGNHARPREYLIPNELLMTSAVENWSLAPSDVRMKVPVGVAYGAIWNWPKADAPGHRGRRPRAQSEPCAAVWLAAFGRNRRLIIEILDRSPIPNWAMAMSVRTCSARSGAVPRTRHRNPLPPSRCLLAADALAAKADLI
jgi:hypothetical protein